MGGVSQCQHATGHVVTGQLAAQRECRTWRCQAQLTQARREGAGQFAVEAVLVQRQHARRPPRQGPDDRAAALGHRQQRQRPARQEALPGRGLVGEIAVHVGHHASLVVVVALDLDAGQLAQGRFGAVSGHRQRRFQATPVIQAQAHTVLVLLQRVHPCRAVQLHARRRQCRPQAILQQAVLDDVAQLASTEAIGIEQQILATGRVPHLHAPVGPGTGLGNGRPHAEAVQQLNIVSGEGEHAQVRLCSLPRRRFAALDQRHRQSGIGQRQRTRGTDHATADDGHIKTRAPAHAASPRHRRGTSPRKPIAPPTSIDCTDALRGHQAEAAQRPHQRRRVAGQTRQSAGERHRLPAVVLAARDVGLQQSIAAGIVLRILQQFGQGQCIAQAQVEALRAQRMDGLRSIAEQHRALTGQRARQHLDEGYELRGPDSSKRPARQPIAFCRRCSQAASSSAITASACSRATPCTQPK